MCDRYDQVLDPFRLRQLKVVSKRRQLFRTHKNGYCWWLLGNDVIAEVAFDDNHHGYFTVTNFPVAGKPRDSICNACLAANMREDLALPPYLLPLLHSSLFYWINCAEQSRAGSGGGNGWADAVYVHMMIHRWNVAVVEMLMRNRFLGVLQNLERKSSRF